MATARIAKGEPAVVLDRLTKRFGSVAAVDNISLQINAGDVYGLIGPNGAGKTTTFSMLAGFLQPTEGAAAILGLAPNDVDSLRGRVGVLPQDALLPAGDLVGEFLVHMGRLQGIESSRVSDLAMAVLTEVDGRNWWSQRCGSLSHGMAKRVSLAQALLGDPELILIDEPTAGLDPRVAHEVRQIIRSRKGRCTVVISSHNLHELEEVCDGAAILDRGRIVASGSMSELTASSEEVRILIAPSAVPVPLDALRALQAVKTVAYDEQRREIAIYFERNQADAETIIGASLWALLNHQVRISGVSKGRGLEQRVMDLT